MGEKEKPITVSVNKRIQEGGMAKEVQWHRVRSRTTKMKVKRRGLGSRKVICNL